MSEWISVEDGLPEVCIITLVYVKSKLQHGEHHFGYREHDGGRWHITTATGNHADFITHWMPLPEPPKEQEQ